MTNVEVKNVSASNMRVNLTDIIGDIPLNEVIAVTKRKDVVAYVISPETFEAVFGSSEDSESETTEPVQTVGDLYEVNVTDDELPSDQQSDDDTDGGELIEFSQLDEDADLEEDNDFEHYLAQLKRQMNGSST